MPSEDFALWYWACEAQDADPSWNYFVSYFPLLMSITNRRMSVTWKFNYASNQRTEFRTSQLCWTSASSPPTWTFTFRFSALCWLRLVQAIFRTETSHKRPSYARENSHLRHLSLSITPMFRSSNAAHCWDRSARSETPTKCLICGPNCSTTRNSKIRIDWRLWS